MCPSWLAIMIGTLSSSPSLPHLCVILFHVILLFFCLSSHLCPDLHPYLTLQTQTEEEEEEAGVMKREKEVAEIDVLIDEGQMLQAQSCQGCLTCTTLRVLDVGVI